MWMLASVTALLTQTAVGDATCASSSDMIHCYDGTMCNVVNNPNCCGKEGRTNCPNKVPFMCKLERTAYNTDDGKSMCNGANCCTSNIKACPKMQHRACYDFYFIKTNGVLRCYDADTNEGKMAALAAYDARAERARRMIMYGDEPDVAWAESMVGAYKVIIHDDCGNHQLSAYGLQPNPDAPNKNSEIIKARNFMNKVCQEMAGPISPTPSPTEYINVLGVSQVRKRKLPGFSDDAPSSPRRYDKRYITSACKEYNRSGPGGYDGETVVRPTPSPTEYINVLGMRN